jgi:PAS domain S-box-containing protein
MKEKIKILDIETTYGENELLVSRTDAKGKIVYSNEIFLRVAGYKEHELLGKPHSIVRHPDMPRCVFKLLWDTISKGEEIFAYVKNLCKDGSYYWVIAHVTPTFNENNIIIGYHSNRRRPKDSAVKIISELYKILLNEEQKVADRRIGLQNSYNLLMKILNEKGLSYEEFVLTI